MDIFFQDPNEVRRPPEEVRLNHVQAEPLLDGTRVKVFLELTPFIKRPNIEIIITNSSGKEVAHTTILEIMQPKIELTMHLRASEPGSEYTIDSTIYYQSLPEPGDAPVTDIPLPDPMIVDRQKKTFILP